MNRHYTIVRLLFSAAAVAGILALPAQVPAGLQTGALHHCPTGPAAEAAATLVPLQLAGLPGAGAAPGKRIFLTVREDVYQNGRLFIAAGARAKGQIQAIRYTETTLYLALELQTVQTVDGPLVELDAEPVKLEVALADSNAPYRAFAARLTPKQTLPGETAGLFRK